MGETSTKPYMIRALHEWCTDNGYTPHIVVVATDQARVPRAYVREGQITLNIGALATHKLSLGNDFITFDARFNGRTEHISVPVATVSAIFARETGAGMGFDTDDFEDVAEDDADEPLADADPEASEDAQADAPAMQAVPPADPASAPPAAAPDGDDDPDKPTRPRLTVVK